MAIQQTPIVTKHQEVVLKTGEVGQALDTGKQGLVLFTNKDTGKQRFITTDTIRDVVSSSSRTTIISSQTPDSRGAFGSSNIPSDIVSYPASSKYGQGNIPSSALSGGFTPYIEEPKPTFSTPKSATSSGYTIRSGREILIPIASTQSGLILQESKPEILMLPSESISSQVSPSDRFFASPLGRSNLPKLNVRASETVRRINIQESIATKEAFKELASTRKLGFSLIPNPIKESKEALGGLITGSFFAGETGRRVLLSGSPTERAGSLFELGSQIARPSTYGKLISSGLKSPGKTVGESLPFILLGGIKKPSLGQGGYKLVSEGGIAKIVKISDKPPKILEISRSQNIYDKGSSLKLLNVVEDVQSKGREQFGNILSLERAVSDIKISGKGKNPKAIISQETITQEISPMSSFGESSGKVIVEYPKRLGGGKDVIEYQNIPSLIERVDSSLELSPYKIKSAGKIGKNLFGSEQGMFPSQRIETNTRITEKGVGLGRAIVFSQKRKPFGIRSASTYKSVFIKKQLDQPSFLEPLNNKTPLSKTFGDQSTIIKTKKIIIPSTVKGQELALQAVSNRLSQLNKNKLIDVRQITSRKQGSPKTLIVKTVKTIKPSQYTSDTIELSRFGSSTLPSIFKRSQPKVFQSSDGYSKLNSAQFNLVKNIPSELQTTRERRITELSQIPKRTVTFKGLTKQEDKRPQKSITESILKQENKQELKQVSKLLQLQETHKKQPLRQPIRQRNILEIPTQTQLKLNTIPKTPSKPTYFRGIDKQPIQKARKLGQKREKTFLIPIPDKLSVLRQQFRNKLRPSTIALPTKGVSKLFEQTIYRGGESFGTGEQLSKVFKKRK